MTNEQADRLRKTEIARLAKRRDNINKKISAIQESCPHTNYEVTHRGSDDNGWDVNVDIHYFEWRKCLTCDKLTIITTISRH